MDTATSSTVVPDDDERPDDVAAGRNSDPPAPWLVNDARPLSTLLNLQAGPNSSATGCIWSLGRLEIGHPDIQLAAWRVACTSMQYRFGKTRAYEVWEQHVQSAVPLSAADRARIDPFLAGVFGTPEAPVPSDHVEGYVAEQLWHMLTLELSQPGRVLRHTEGPSFTVTESGGDGLAIWSVDGAGFAFRLWEIKKDTSSGHISRTIARASKQLSRRSEEYLAKYVAIGSRQHQGDLGLFFAELLELWLDDDPASGAGIAIATSREKAPIRQSFGAFTSTFPRQAEEGRLEGLFVALGDFRAFSQLVRDYVWTGR